MATGISKEPPAAQPVRPSLGAGAFPSRQAIDALRSHPRFPEAVRAATNHLVEKYSRNGLLNRVINDRGRMIGSLVALYLHLSAPPGGDGLTVSRFQAYCVKLKLCSPGRARALLLLLRYGGFLVPDPSTSDRRQRRLVPTEPLIEAHRQRWKRQFEALALIAPEGRPALALLDQPEFITAFVRQLGVSYLAGFRVLDHAPELTDLVESNAGLLVISSLFLAAVERPQAAEGMAVPVSISAQSLRFGIARAHARNLLAEAAEAGLVSRAGGSEVIIVLPRLVQAMSGFFAATFALLAHCAGVAAKEIGSLPGPAMPGAE
jgi:hypothetical protein